MTAAVREPLLGSDFAAVCERHGAPLACSHVGGVLRLSYRVEHGGVRDDAIELVDGVVATECPGIVRSTRSCSRDEAVGMPVERALPRLLQDAGRLLQSEPLGDSTRLYFEDCVVTAHEGTVACIVPRPPG